MPILRKFQTVGDRFSWEGVKTKSYKPEGSHFRGITRQVLFEDGLPAQWRYFEIEPGGYSSFEKHQHIHAVMILSGKGKTLIGEKVYKVAPFDLIYVPPETWHQFYAGENSPLGFLCLVDCNRDRPVRPNAEEKAALLQNPLVSPHIQL